MQANVITLANQKGGVGKSTLTMLLAGTAARRGYRVLVIGADSQGSAERWAAAALDEAPFPAAVIGGSEFGPKLHREVGKFLQDYDVIFIDGPPAADIGITRSALLVSDLALIPTQLSPLDLYALQPFLKTVEDVRVVNEELRVRLVPNMCQLNTRIAQEVMAFLDEQSVEATRTRVHQRTVYRAVAAYGTTIDDVGSSAPKAAREEMSALTDEVLALVGRPELASASTSAKAVANG